ncbi:MAG: hypothetical protein VX924_01580 [Candidatus Neomarinimicrobiota bacterium]|nr:hypothetical protein [Candidatus Neomarinimicrobiota bacterium]|tara:strand:- start:465 stop:908 length:444 start_codon:yes stop_codon:yes gene_type:complete
MLSKYADTLKRRGLDTCSSQILADVLESFPKSVSVKQLALNTGKTEKYINSKLRAMKRDDVPISIKKGSRNNYVTTSMFEPVYWILKEKENAEMALEDLNKIEMNGDPSVNKKKRIVKRIYREYLKDMNDLIDRWYSLRLIQSLKDD